MSGESEIDSLPGDLSQQDATGKRPLLSPGEQRILERILFQNELDSYPQVSKGPVAPHWDIDGASNETWEL